MKKTTTFYIFEIGALYFLIIFTLSTVIAFYQLLTGDEFVNTCLFSPIDSRMAFFCINGKNKN